MNRTIRWEIVWLNCLERRITVIFFFFSVEENFAQHGTFSMENSSVREKCNYCNSANHLVIVYYRPSRWRIFTYLISAEEIATNRTNFHLRLRIQNVIALLFVFVIGQKLFRKSASIQRGCLFNIEFRPNKSKLKIFFDESFFFFIVKNCSLTIIIKEEHVQHVGFIRLKTIFV